MTDQLTRVERDIASAKERVAWQKKNIDKLTREGRKTDLAEAMLASWERILLAFEQHREVIRTWLTEKDANPQAPSCCRNQETTACLRTAAASAASSSSMQSGRRAASVCGRAATTARSSARRTDTRRRA